MSAADFDLMAIITTNLAGESSPTRPPRRGECNPQSNMLMTCIQRGLTLVYLHAIFSKT
jgi:hypothetical protein